MSERGISISVAANHFYKNNDKKPIIEFVNEIYNPIDGQLFAGFSMGKEQSI